MPIYEYKCTNCGNQLEAMQKVSDAPLRECPQCHENKLEKQWSLSGFQFKGSGWYISDYTNRGKEAKSENGSAAEKPAASGDAAKTSSGTESTADASAASKPEKKAA
jgi:putative FmdB family regulatory protein